MDALIFVENVKYYCNKKGEAPTVACKNAGVGTSFISDIKRGQTPSVAKVQLLANYLGVTTSELLGEETKKPAAESGDGQAEKLAQALQGIGIDVDKLTEAEISRIARPAKAALEE